MLTAVHDSVIGKDALFAKLKLPAPSPPWLGRRKAAPRPGLTGSPRPVISRPAGAFGVNRASHEESNDRLGSVERRA